MKSKLILTMLLMLSNGFGPFFLQPAESFVLPGFETLCSAFAGAASIGVCEKGFEESMGPFIEEKSVPTFIYCCAVTTLRYCVVDKIGDTCGSNAKESANLIIDGIVRATKLFNGEQPCDGNEFYYRKESPLCWHFFGWATGVILMLILLGSCLCFLCVRCCTCCRRSRRPQLILLEPKSTAPYTQLQTMPRK